LQSLNQIPSKILFNVPDAAAALSLSRSKFYELMQSGALKTVKIGQRRLVPAQSLAAYANALVEAA
jgi:excisionase family DNA binding protein